MNLDNTIYDLVILGATGFVGRLVCQYLQTYASQQEGFHWAIAGRSQSKLEVISTSLTARGDVPIILADATDIDSLRRLCGQARVVVSTVGPYAKYGEPLVEACAETGTDYCDLTGESPWIRRMIDQYRPLAQQTGARIVHCCGFDSVPSDLGVFCLQQASLQRWGQPCTSVDMRVLAARGGFSGGTIASGLALVDEAQRDTTLKQKLQDPYFLCPQSIRSDNQASPLPPVQFDKHWQEWVAPFVMAAVNTPIVLRSNYLQDYAYGESFRYSEGILTRGGPIGWLVAQGLKLGLDGLAIAAALPPSRWLLENTVVPASGEGPSQEEQEQGFYDLRFYGTTDSGKKLTVKVKGDRDPGYGSTSKILAQTALCLAKDCPKSDKSGDFWTPAAVGGKALLGRLERHAGVTFTVLDGNP